MVSSLFLVALVFTGATFGFMKIGLPLPGPLAVLLSGALAVRLSRPAPWAALGLGRLARPARLPLQVLVVMLLTGLAGAMSTLLATRVLGWAPIEMTPLVALRGNAPLLAMMLAVSWGAAALGEELLFRGFLQGRLQSALAPRAGKWAAPAAILLQALVFGLCHAYQGPTGILMTTSVGLAFGLAYRRLRSLWPLVIAHGLVDTAGMIALYAGVAVPG